MGRGKRGRKGEGGRGRRGGEERKYFFLLDAALCTHAIDVEMQ
jgi:hypothetical protein